MPSQKSGKYCCSPCQIEHRLNEAIASGNYTKNNAKTYFKRNTPYKCSCCGISEWNGNPIVLQIDHIDGNNSNDVIENYRYLCPNCHTQTDTWGVKNASEEGRLRMSKKKLVS
jgi:Zn finger protein HypA/HybF involved in hydrogenase expression